MSTSNSQTPRGPGAPAQQRRRMTALLAAGFAVSMLGAAYAAVPLYRLFCQVTGYGGTTQRAEAPSGKVIERRVTVRFDSTVAGGLPWIFKPRQRAVELKLGESALVYYEARNTAANATKGTATFNVTPEAAGRYFNKIECFCFSEQALEPGAEAALPLTFYVDPEMADDPDLDRVDEITLSYTFFPLPPDDDPAERAKRGEGTGT